MSVQNITLPYGNNAGGEAAVGSVLSVAVPGSPTNYLFVGNAGNQKWPLAVKNADVTNQGTAWTRSIPTLFEGGKFTVDIYFIPSSTNTATIEGHSFASGLGSLFTTATICQWKLQFPDGVTWYFSGYILDFNIDMAVDKALTIPMSIQIVGEPIFA
jgi:hypothetical protein